MNKTVHQKLTDKYQYAHPVGIDFSYNDDTISSFGQENKLLKQAAADLLSPRQEVINRLLEMSRSI